MTKILEHLSYLYGEQGGRETFGRLEAVLHRYRGQLGTPPIQGLSEKDAVLITYPDQVQEPGVPHLQTLAQFCGRHLAGLISTIHLLPFFPYSSDDGFSVVDYRSVRADLGGWDDIVRLGRSFRLMFDAVINHVSAQGEWFAGFLRDEPATKDYFIVVEGDPDLSQVVRPRALPLLTRFQTPSGEKAVWTTFSADQIDLNYRNPSVLLEIIDILLFYIAHGAEFLRLDAIAYLWKEIGTPCIHQPQTHRLVQLLRAVLDEVAPHVALITETNVPHDENLSYFGNGTNEAQLVYNFALPPLVLQGLQRGSARYLSDWAKSLSLPGERVTFFNFLASHDGIGLNPARGLLPQAEIDGLIERATNHGGRVSYKRNTDGTGSPYELNINYFDALSDPREDEPFSTPVDRFLTAQAIMLAMAGVPGIYFHSLFGSHGWPEGVSETGHNRAVNRQKLTHRQLEDELRDEASLRAHVFGGYARLLHARAGSPAFHPSAPQQVVDCGEAVFGLLRTAPGGGERILCLHNLSRQRQRVRVDSTAAAGRSIRTSRDLLRGGVVDWDARQGVLLRPYETVWIRLGR